MIITRLRFKLRRIKKGGEKYMKKLATIGGSIALLAATIVPVFAANSCMNGTTGPLSTNNCTVRMLNIR
jgi:hypothetical protein